MNGTLRKSLLIVGVALALVAGACGNDDNGDTDDTTTTTENGETGAGGDRGNVDGEVVFGTLVPQSGDLQVIVESLATPIEMAIEEINEAGGLLGSEVRIVPGDDGTNANVAQTSYDQLVNTENVDVIIGPAPSSVASNMVDTFETDRLPVCSGSTTSAELTGSGGGYFFRTAPADRLQGPALANLIQSDGHQSVAIVARNDDYGNGFANLLGEALEEGGSEVTETVLYDPESGSGYDADVQRAIDSDPDAVAIIGFNDDGAQIVNVMIGQGAGPGDVPIYTADGMQSSGFAETVDENDPSSISGIKGTAPAAAPDGVEHPFTARFAETGVDTIFSSYYYDCTILMALAIAAADSEDGSDIADAFAGNLEGDNECQTFAECIEYLDEGETIHYQGASSSFQQWDEMEPGTGVYDVWQYNDSGEVEGLEGQQITIE